MHDHALAETILSRSSGTGRFITAICGPPGSGKSTLATAVCNHLTAEGESVVVVPMDGYHLDDGILDQRGWRSRKGAPHTFDAAGFAATLGRIREHREEIFVPVFDRSMELSRAAARSVGLDDRLVLVEGNYLLLDAAPWSGMRDCFDLTVFLDIDPVEIRERSIARWLHYGLRPEQALEKAEANDVPNGQYVIDNSVAADMVLKNQ